MNAPLRILLVGAAEEDFYLIQDLLSRDGTVGEAALDQASSLEEALRCFGEKTYDLVVIQHDSADGIASSILKETRRRNLTFPFILLAENANEAAIAEIIQAGAPVCIARSELNEACLARSIRYALALHSKECERHSAEEMVRKLSRAVEQSADLVVITDRTGVIEYVNPAFEALTGYAREEVIGRTPRLLKSGQQSQALYRELWTTILSGKVFRGTVINRKKNGDLFYAEKTITPVRDTEGRITHFISNDRDITDRYRLEAELRQAQKMDAVGQLAGGVAHDFNNLLLVISSYAELMLDTIGADSRLQHHAQEILKAAQRAADLTRQLLAFSRKQMRVLQVMDLNRVLSEIAGILPRLIGEDIHMRIIPGSDLGMIKADPVQIEQILMNLAANARDAMPSGGSLTIETANVHLDDAYLHHHPMVPAGDYVRLTVTDSGCGIDAEHLPHIFEPFYTTKGKDKGTGLGLATVYGIVKQNSGFIWVYSEPGMGTTFKIYLPESERGALKPGRPKNQDFPVAGHETVLLVEDEEAVRRSCHEFLTSSGYRVLEARDGQHALEVAREHVGHIDLLVSDVVMPHLSGGELAERLMQERPDMKVLFVSGYAEKTVLQHGVIDLQSGFLQKPFSLKTLARSMREVLDASGISHPSSGSVAELHS
jgi:two-component system cell cycle sensor histidine kinase/response regulator CckA